MANATFVTAWLEEWGIDPNDVESVEADTQVNAKGERVNPEGSVLVTVMQARNGKQWYKVPRRYLVSPPES